MVRRPATVAFWQGKLPHWEVVEGRYFVTVHLAGAIPKQGQDRIHALAAEVKKIPKSNAEARLKVVRRVFEEMERWLDHSEYVTHLQRQEVAKMVSEAITSRHQRIWNVLEYVIMPSHLHLFLELLSGGLRESMQQFKRWTGHEACKILHLKEKRFWQDEWFDHWSRSDDEDSKIVAYIRQNPEKARLVSNYLDWPYGSWKTGTE